MRCFLLCLGGFFAPVSHSIWSGPLSETDLCDILFTLITLCYIRHVILRAVQAEDNRIAKRPVCCASQHGGMPRGVKTCPGRDMPVGSNAPDRQYDLGGRFVYRRIPYASSGTLAYGSDPNLTLLVNQPVKKHGMKGISSPLTVSQSLRTNTSACMSMAVAGTRLPTPCWTALACPAS